jgi:hypothetical protein
MECLSNLHLLILSPIVTYGHRATTKGGLQYTDHAVIYTGNKPPKVLPGEPNLLLEPIQVLTKMPRDRLAGESRINYAKIYTVEHNVKVAFIGKISPASERRFMNDFDSVWETKNKIKYSEDPYEVKVMTEGVAKSSFTSLA